MRKNTGILFFCLFFWIMNSCSPKLNITEIEERINKDYTAFNDGDVEYEIKNTSKKYLKLRGEDGLRKNLVESYSNRKNPPYFGKIGDLALQDRKKCNSTYYYYVKYKVNKSEFTPYLDSTALQLNYKIYGKESVYFNSNSKILEVIEKKSRILYLDKDRVWKLENYSSDMKYLNRYFGKGFSECVHSNVENSEFIPYGL
ncbi:MAG: hypothetical protein WAV86_07970 [Lutibacter sp.]